MNNPESLLKSLYLERSSRHPAYSLRAFGRDLGIAPSGLSEILSGKRRLSAPLAKRVLERISLSDDQKKILLGSSSQNSTSPKLDEIELDSFSRVAEWHYWAILNLLQTSHPPRTVSEIARRLALKEKTVREALRRLIRLELVEKREKKYLARPESERIKTPTDVPSAAIRLLHGQLLKKGQESLDTDLVTERDFSALILPGDMESLPEVKKEIKSFRRRIARLFKKTKCDRVFAFNIQCFALDKKETTQ